MDATAPAPAPRRASPRAPLRTTTWAGVPYRATAVTCSSARARSASTMAPSPRGARSARGRPGREPRGAGRVHQDEGERHPPDPGWTGRAGSV